MNRRKLLTGAGATGAALAAVTGTTLRATANSTDPAATSSRADAALIALAARYPAAVDTFNRYAGPDDSPEDNRLRAEVTGIFVACMAARPTTLEKLTAKARVALRDALDAEEMPADQVADQMSRSIVHDLLRLAQAR